MAEIVTETNCIRVDDALIPKNTVVVNLLPYGVRLSSVAGRWSQNILVEDSTIDGVSVVDNTELYEFFLANGFFDGGSTGTSGVQSIIAGTNVTVDNSDPKNPIVNATGGSGGIQSVTGDIVDDTDPDNPVIDLPSSVVVRDVNGDITVNPPINPTNPATKDYVDNMSVAVTNLERSTGVEIIPEMATFLAAPDAPTARTALGLGTSNLQVGTAATDAKAGDYTPQVTEIKRDATDPLLASIATFLASSTVTLARANYAAFLLAGAGGLNGASTQGARQDHNHAIAEPTASTRGMMSGEDKIKVDSMRSDAAIAITDIAAVDTSLSTVRTVNIATNSEIVLTNLKDGVFNIIVTNTDVVTRTVSVQGVPYSGNQDMGIPPGKDAIISIAIAGTKVKAVISPDAP